MRPAHPQSRPQFAPSIVRLAPLACLLAACGGSGSGAGGESTNTGAYDAEAFGYVDPYPSDFHPLGRDEVFAAVRRDEIACLFTGTSAPFAIEDAAAVAETTAMPAAATSGITVLDADTGDLDGDGKPELVLVGTFGSSSSKGLRVRILGMAGGVGSNVGSWTLLASFDAGPSAEAYRSGRVDVGDVDGDGRAEIVVAATRGSYVSWVRVYEDPVDGAGHGSLVRELSYPGARAVRGITAQLDDDSGRELAVHVQLNGSAAEGHVFDDAAHDFVQLTSSAEPLYSGSGSGYVTGDLLAVNRDADGRDEIALVRSPPSVAINVFDDALAGFGLLATQSAFVNYMVEWEPDDPRLMRRFDAGDLDADGLDEVVLLLPHESMLLGLIDSVGVLTLWGAGGNSLLEADAGSVPELRGWDVAVVDHDGDGLDEIVSAVTSSSHVYWNAWEYDPDAFGDLSSLSGPFDLGSEYAPNTNVVLAGDDFDVDGVRLRWTGVKYQRLPNPIPMAVLAAPPTKAGISQGYDASDVTYGTSQGYEFSYETSTTHSGSIMGGKKWKDVFGVAEVSVKVTLKGALKFTSGESDSVSTSVSYTGSFDHDVVIFQGTLHMVYLYEILSADDPEMIGTEMSINVPVGTKVYKWTREYFEERFGPNTFLADVPLEHTIGDPTSYVTEGAAADLLSANGGFQGESVTVGQGNGSNGCALAMEHQDMEGDGWSWGVDVDVEAEIGPFQGGLSYSFEREHIWEVTVSRGTTYESTIGDISDPAQWEAWAYTMGLFTYTLEQPERSPYQIVTFWTQPWGTSY